MQLADGSIVEVGADEVSSTDKSNSRLKAGLVGAGAAASASALASVLSSGDNVDTPQGVGRVLSNENVRRVSFNSRSVVRLW